MKGYHHKNPRRTVPFVTAAKHGRLVVNKPAMEALQRAGVTYVRLLVSPTTFALESVNAETPHAFHLAYRRSQVDLNVPNFWKHLGVDVANGPQRFPATWDADARHLVCYLEKSQQ